MNFRIHFNITLLLVVLLPALWGCPSTQVDYVDVDKSAAPGTTATLHVPDYIDLYSIDNKVIEEYYVTVLYSGARVIHMAPGWHAVVLRYNDIWDLDDDSRDHEKIRSRYVDLSFTAESGKSYRVAIEEPNDLEEARELAADFKVWIVDRQTGKKISE